jgi:hypothetical protein
MGWFILKHIFSTIFTFITIGRLSHLEKDLEILVLRQQLSILQRKLNHPIRPSRVEKITLAVLITKIMRTSHQSTNQPRDIIRIFQPETVLRWHRELVRWKWSYPNNNKGGRPTISKEIEKLILRLARENPRWVRTARQECLDHILIINAAHLQRVLIEFIQSYNVSRPHQGIDQQIPILSAVSPGATIQCTNILGGIIHNYYRAPTHTALSTT